MEVHIVLSSLVMTPTSICARTLEKRVLESIVADDDACIWSGSFKPSAMI